MVSTISSGVQARRVGGILKDRHENIRTFHRAHYEPGFRGKPGHVCVRRWAKYEDPFS